jgi:hypothetical protein
MNDFDARLPREPAEHPSPEALFEAVRGVEDESGRPSILRHAESCATCAAEILHITAFQEPAPLSPAKADAAWRNFGNVETRTREYGRTRFSPWMLAAAAVVVAAVAVVPFLQRSKASDTERGAKQSTVLISPRGTLSAPPAEFIFQATGSGPVRVTVFDSARNFAWTSAPTSAGRVTLPESQRQILKFGRQYSWTLLEDEGTAPIASFTLENGAEPPHRGAR